MRPFEPGLLPFNPLEPGPFGFNPLAPGLVRSSESLFGFTDPDRFGDPGVAGVSEPGALPFGVFIPGLEYEFPGDDGEAAGMPGVVDTDPGELDDPAGTPPEPGLPGDPAPPAASAEPAARRATVPARETKRNEEGRFMFRSG